MHGLFSQSSSENPKPVLSHLEVSKMGLAYRNRINIRHWRGCDRAAAADENLADRASVE
jgi:hypothetical protein